MLTVRTTLWMMLSVAGIVGLLGCDGVIGGQVDISVTQSYAVSASNGRADCGFVTRVQ